MAISLRTLESFGDVAAEDDAVLDYFLSTDAVEKIESNQVFLVLGRKGSGKTAIVRHFSEGTANPTSKSVSLKGYPWNVHALRSDDGASEIEAYVASWRFLIAVELAQLACSLVPSNRDKDVKAIRTFLTDNYGTESVTLDKIIQPEKLRLSSGSFEPEVLGCKLGAISLERASKNMKLGLELNALTETIFRSVDRLMKQQRIPGLYLHFDELDQGLVRLDDQRGRMLVGLILAARSARRDFVKLQTDVNPVIYLRTDIWDDLEFSDKNKINQTNTLHLEWDTGSLQDLVNERLNVKLDPNATWDDIATSDLMRGSQTKWNHILARTFLRPRDVISFLNIALGLAKRREDDPLRFENPDIVDARNGYSTYLKSELDDEVLSHWQYWEEALQACSAMATITFSRDQFEAEYEKRRSADNRIAAAQALKMLYDFSIIGYERRSGYGGSSWAFEYSDPEAGWDNGATRFKVHLGLKEYAKLKEDRA